MKNILFLLLIVIYSCKKEVKVIISSNENEVIEVYNYSELELILNTIDDNTYVINFWATWCAPCVKELPYFQELHNTYDKGNVKVILVSLDFPDKLESQLIPFVVKKNITAQVILLDDPNENIWIPKIDKSWSGALPATLIYNKNKRVFYEQSFTKELLFKEIEKFI
ncbi:MAG: TlpA family protein disulfide reductase [Flavobacteriaceae bacterium]|nr:TlpA family protein disulfide reductase [Flavobacteriaceae bacterium]